MTENILFICGSLNQTTQLHQIARQMEAGYNCYFTPYYANGIEDFAATMGWLDFTVLGGRHMRDTCTYLAEHKLPMDERGEGHKYDLVVTCSDLILQKNIRGKRIVLIQEGITEPEGWFYKIVKALKFLPRYIANTAASGLSDEYDIFCVASEGYREAFINKGIRPEKIAVTGIPNFDNLSESLRNNFPYRDYVLVATTPYRESFRADNRMAFLQYCAEMANGRTVIFKLHPAEHYGRAHDEIKSVFPEALVFHRGNVNHMIANASTVITQQSTCTFVALALEKKTYTYLDKVKLRRLMPIQNKGTSAEHIASICHRLLLTPMPVLKQIRKGYRARPRWEKTDAIYRILRKYLNQNLDF